MTKRIFERLVNGQVYKTEGFMLQRTVVRQESETGRKRKKAFWTVYPDNSREVLTFDYLSQAKAHIKGLDQAKG